MVHPLKREVAGLRTSCPQKGWLESSFIQVVWCHQATYPKPSLRKADLLVKLSPPTTILLNKSKALFTRLWLASQLPPHCWWSTSSVQVRSTSHNLIPSWRGLRSLFHHFMSGFLLKFSNHPVQALKAACSHWAIWVLSIVSFETFRHFNGVMWNRKH